MKPAEPGTGNTSSAVIPGGRLASQTTSPSTTTWRDSEPDMQTPNLTAGKSLSESAGGSSEPRAEDADGLERAGHGGNTGSLMSPFLPTLPSLSYGLMRGSETSPAGSRVSA